jgi:hypothetical protein
VTGGRLKLPALLKALKNSVSIYNFAPELIYTSYATIKNIFYWVAQPDGDRVQVRNNFGKFGSAI